jgi:cobalamin biosynthetic protein CobC
MRHGGDLAGAVGRYGGPGNAWLDLSTGINPEAYPFRSPEADCWRRLPQSAELDELLAAARVAYGAPERAPILAAPGTQIIIQSLPLLRPASRVAIVGPTYSEHAICWRRTGATLSMIPDLTPPADAEVVVAVNPNSPDGRIWMPYQVLACAEALAARGGLLIMDEAFADIAPEVSVAGKAGTEGLIILRSFGKFFGLAGLRLGFALGPERLIEELDARLGPWAVSGPAIEIGTQALADLGWQQGARARCYQRSARLDNLLGSAGFRVVGGTALYRLAEHEDAAAIHQRLAERSVWVRNYGDAREWLRFGLPGTDIAFEKLANALRAAMP